MKATFAELFCFMTLTVTLTQCFKMEANKVLEGAFL